MPQPDIHVLESSTESQHALVTAVAALFAVDLPVTDIEADRAAIREDLETRSREELADLLIRADKELKRKELDLNVAANIGKQLLAQVNHLKKQSSIASPARSFRPQSPFHSDVPRSPELYASSAFNESFLYDQTFPPRTPESLNHIRNDRHPRVESLENENYNLMLQLETSQAAYLSAEEKGRRNLTSMEKEIQCLKRELEEASKDTIIAHPNILSSDVQKRTDQVSLRSSTSDMGNKERKSTEGREIIENTSLINESNISLPLGILVEDKLAENTQTHPPFCEQTVPKSSSANTSDFAAKSSTHSSPLSLRESHLTDTLKEKIEQLTRLNEEARIDFETKLAEMETYRDKWIRMERDNSLTDSPIRNCTRRRIAGKTVHKELSSMRSDLLDIEDNARMPGLYPVKRRSPISAGLDKSISSIASTDQCNDLDIDADFQPLPIRKLADWPVRSLSTELAREFGTNWLDQFVEAEINVQTSAVNEDEWNIVQNDKGMPAVQLCTEDDDSKQYSNSLPPKRTYSYMRELFFVLLTISFVFMTQTLYLIYRSAVWAYRLIKSEESQDSHSSLKLD